MAHGYENGGKYRGGKKNRKKSDSGVGKNDKHGTGENHSQKPKSNGRKAGGKGN